MKRDAMIKRDLAYGAAVAIAAAVVTNCIAPQQAAQCPCTNASTTSGSPGSTSSASDSPTTKAASSSSSAPPAVKPSGPLIFDGKSASLLNIDPPGSWFVLNDRTAKGTMTPATTADFAGAVTNGVIHTSGKGFSDWGGGIGFNFVGADSLTPLDASAYTGISFKASGSAPMHIGLATKATMPEFGDCTKCYDHYAADIGDLSSTPKVYTFKWSQLKSGGWGAPKAALDPHTLVGLNFTSKGAAPWDFTLDDISFTR
jgi:hypothetical protein